jgi:PleD family two-component response regulator
VTGAAGEALGRSRVLLTGDAAARPEGLERALTRAGFHIEETAPAPDQPPPDALLTTLRSAEGAGLEELLAAAATEPPRIIVFTAEDREGPMAALTLGAADALAAPVHLAELCARLALRIRDRQAPSRTPYETRIRDSLRGLVDEAGAVLHPDEITLALVRRLGRALGLAHCAFVITRPGEDEGRVIADVPEARAEHDRLDLTRYPEIGEAVRTRRALSMADAHAGGGAAPAMIVVPATADESVVGVLLIRGQPSAPPLNAAQLGLAGSLAEAAARAIVSARATDGSPTRVLTPPTLDRRLQEELERARRYSLGFSLVLLDMDGSPEGPRGEAAAAGRPPQELGARLRRELRLPDFVSGYGDREYAVVLPETGADGARRSVVRLRERLAVASAGIAAYPHPGVSVPDDLFALVEAALRRARAQGGDRIGVAE